MGVDEEEQLCLNGTFGAAGFNSLRSLVWFGGLGFGLSCLATNHFRFEKGEGMRPEMFYFNRYSATSVQPQPE